MRPCQPRCGARLSNRRPHYLSDRRGGLRWCSWHRMDCRRAAGVVRKRVMCTIFTGSMGSLRASAFAVPSMMCTCCTAPIALGMLESGAGTASALVYWLANPVLNPAALVFIGFVLGWQWAVLRLVFGVALVFIV